MRKLMLIVPLICLTAGCVYPAHTLSGGYPRQRPMYPRAAGPQFDLASLPVGRWDNVMMTAVGTPLLVLLKDGTTASGDVISATSETLRLRVASGDVDLAAAEVMRVDRLSGRARSLVKDGARGAAFGAGVVGVLALIVGQVPPPRLFAAGAIVGAEQNAQLGSLARGAVTIYLAEGAIPAAVARPAAPVVRRGPCVPGGSPCNPQLRFRQ